MVGRMVDAARRASHHDGGALAAQGPTVEEGSWLHAVLCKVRRRLHRTDLLIM